jgi:hypothetical protein
MSLYGVHDLSDRLPVDWLVDAVAIGHNPNAYGGKDYSRWDPTIICRLNNGWHPDGTIPLPRYYDDFAQRCANFVTASRGCDIWIVGNEWNLSIERPHEQVITAADYISCYRRVRAAIKNVSPDAWVVPAAIGPWNVETGDWLQLYYDVLSEVEAEAICWHTYTHGVDPALVESSQDMATYPGRYYQFRAYMDFEDWTPKGKRDLPVLITEANQDGPWAATGWIEAAYQEIKRNATMDVQCLCLFRAIETGDGYHLTDSCWNELGQIIANEEDDMAGWQDVWVNRCEQGFVVQGDQHLQVAKGLTVHYVHGGEGDYPRPELKPKDKKKGQPEVYEGRYSQSGFYTFAPGRYGLVSDPIFITPGARTRASVMYMHVLDQKFALGARLGIIDGDGPFTGGPVWPIDGGVDPFTDDAIVWGGWRWARQGDINLPEREWAKLSTPEIEPSGDYVRLVAQFNNDIAASGHGHWDVFRIEQYTDDPTPPSPEPGDGITIDEVRQVVRQELGNLRLVLD